MLRKFDEKLKEVKESQKHIEEGFRVFADNEKKYRVSSLRKVDEIVGSRSLIEIASSCMKTTSRRQGRRSKS